VSTKALLENTTNQATLNRSDKASDGSPEQSTRADHLMHAEQYAEGRVCFSVQLQSGQTHIAALLPRILLSATAYPVEEDAVVWEKSRDP